MQNSTLVVQKLKDLLGTESGNNWLNFMDYIHDELSLILKQGKPKKADIEKSIIGQSGFASWREMIEASEKNNGLGWSHASFDSWKRAYSVVLKHSYLRKLELTASQINTIQRESKPDFPKTLDEFKAFSDTRKIKQAKQHQNSLKDAQNRTTELQKENDALGQQLLDLNSVAEQLANTKEENIKLQTKLDDRISEIEILNKKITEITKSNNELEFKIKNSLSESWINRFLSFFKPK